MRFLLIFLFFGSISTFAQSEKLDIQASTMSLPSGNNQMQQYSFIGEENILSTYSTIYYNHRRIRDNRKWKQKQQKIKVGVEIFQAYTYIKTHLEDSIYELPRSLFDLDSTDLSYLTENELITDSSVLLNFELFIRQTNKVVQTVEDGLSLIYLQPHQIDGPRLLVQIHEDSIMLIDLNIGLFESSTPKSFQEWILLAEACGKFDLFNELKLTQSYFCRERMSLEIAHYIETLRK